jgi:hypothetical protein
MSTCVDDVAEKEPPMTVTRALLGMLFIIAITAAATPAHATEVTFRDCGGLICFEASFDGGKPRTLVLDTGNVNSYVTAGAAQAMGWKIDPIVQDGKPIPGISSSGQHKVKLGGVELAVKPLVFDASAIGEGGPPGDGALAYTAFKDRVVRVDYPHHLISVSDVITTKAAPDAHAGRMEFVTFGKEGPPIVVGGPFTVNGKPLRAQIDSCYTGTLLVYDAALPKLGLAKSGAPKLFPYTDGGVNMLAGPAQRVGFAARDAVAQSSTVYFVGAGKNTVHQPDGLFEATVGNALFAHDVLVLDFHAMTVDVLPAS